MSSAILFRLAPLVALLLCAPAHGFTGVGRRPTSLPSTVPLPPSGTPSRSPSLLSATSIAAEKPPRRRKFFRNVRRAVVGAVTLTSFRQQRNKVLEADADPVTTTGNIVELRVGNLDGDSTASAGVIKIQLFPEWAPIGAKRFEELVEQSFFDNARVFRVVPGVLCQFGIHGDPLEQAKRRDAVISSDPVRVSNTRGTLVFCKSAPGLNNSGRTSQVAINTRDNASLDAAGFSPFARVIEGMDLVDRFYSGYHSDEPKPGMIQAKGDEYLRPNFPKLSFISKATVVSREDDNKNESA